MQFIYHFDVLFSVFCAIVSHPADTIVSYMNKAEGATIGSSVKVLGFGGLWAGLGPRIIMIGTLTALQWFIYDGVKVCNGRSRLLAFVSEITSSQNSVQ